jgi:hypothetical protein
VSFAVESKVDTPEFSALADGRPDVAALFMPKVPVVVVRGRIESQAELDDLIDSLKAIRPGLRA